MFNLFRKIDCPAGFNFSTPLIKRNVIRYIHQHDEIIRLAEQRANEIIAQAKEDASLLKEQVRQEVCTEIKNDLNVLKVLFHDTQHTLIEQSTTLCTEICAVALERLVDSLSDRKKIDFMIRELLDESYSSRELIIQCNPLQFNILSEALADIMADLMNLRKWKVKPDNSLGEFQLKISSSNGAEVHISIQNIITIFKKEIQQSMSIGTTDDLLELRG